MREAVKAQIAVLDKVHRTYFEGDRQKQLKTKIDEITALLDTRPIELVANKREKADLLYLRGRALDYLPEYSKSAEEYLSKAVKLLPGFFEAWDALGHVYWKKRDIAGARKCFEGSLEQNPLFPDALRHLSMVLRQLDDSNPESKKENFRQSIALANKAVLQNLADSESWYVLGNAYLTNFFTNDQKAEDLNSALKAYKQAEQLQKEPNPDLYYNRGQIYEHLEKYNEAIQDFNRAHEIDPTLQADKKASKIADLVAKASEPPKPRINPKSLLKFKTKQRF